MDAEAAVGPLMTENTQTESVGQASDTAGAASNGVPVQPEASAPTRDARYPLSVQYCPFCTLPAEIHEYVSKTQFEKCKEWLRRHAPHYFPAIFPEECAARLEALRLAEETGADIGAIGDEIQEDEVKVAKPIEQKTSGGKKKKTPAEVILALGQRKGKKQVTIVYGLDLFGIKLKEAAKAAKRKFATGSSITTSADNRDVIEIQGSRQEDFAELVHKEWGVPKNVIFIVNAQKKKVKAFP